MAKFDAKSYTKNVIHSAGYIATETIKGVNPTLTTYIKDTTSDAKEMYDSVKEFKRDPKGKVSSILEKYGFKEVDKARRNILDDIRTGKFYNPDREKAAIDKYMKDNGFSFDDIDFDVDINYGEDESSSSNSNSSNDMNRFSITQQKLTAASTDEIVRGYNKGASANIANNTRMFSIVNTSLASINTSIINLHQDLAKPLNNHIINSTNFYQVATSELSKQTAYLENMNAILMDRFAPRDSRRGFKNRKLETWDDIMDGGLPNIKKILGQAKKNAWDNSDFGLITDLFSPDMIELFSGAGLFSSPIAMIMKEIATSKVQNSATGKSLDRLVKSLNRGTTSLFSRIHNYNMSGVTRVWDRKKNDYVLKQKNGILGFLASIFDIFPNVKSGGKIDRSKYKPYERADWTNKDSRALELIPDMLSNIYSAISGTTPQVYDYKAGVWKNKRAVKNDFEKSRLENIRESTADFGDEITNQFVNKVNNANPNLPNIGLSSRATRTFAHDYELVLQELTLSKVKVSEISKSTLTNMCNTLARRGVINRANIRIIVSTLYDNPATRAGLQNSVLQARIADQTFMEGSASSTYARSTNGATISKNSLSSQILKVTDDKNHDLFFYLQHYYMRLDEIRDILNNGKGISAKNKYNNSTGKRSRRYTVPTGKANGFEHSPIVRGFVSTPEAIDLSSRSSRDIYTNKGYIQLSDAEFESAASNKTEQKKKDEGSPLSRGIDKITNFLSELLTGEGPITTEIKEKGFLGYIKDLPQKISEGISNEFHKIVDKVKGYFKSLWDKFTKNANGATYKDSIKGMLSGFGNSLVSHAKSKAGNLVDWFNENKPSWMGNVASPSGSYRGGQVTKSGMVSVSEGEMIVPSEYNPFYFGKTSKSHQKATEAMNYRNWVASGSKGGEYWGSYSKGSKGVKRKRLNKREIEEIKRRYNEGQTVEQIASEMKKPISQIQYRVNEFNFKSDVDDVKSNVQEKTNNTFNKIKNTDLGKSAQDLGSKMAKGIDKSMTDLFGKNWGEAKDSAKIAADTIKKTVPQTAAAGTLGALVGGAMTGSGLGLLGGFVIGSGIMTLKNSKELNEKLFGTADDAGNYSGGKLPANVATFIKKQLPGMAKSGALGSVLGAFGIAPGGLLGGFVLGAGIDLLAQNEKVQNTVTQLLFGNKNVNGERTGGIVGSLKARVVDPLADYVKEGTEKLTKYFKDEILSPLKKATKSLTDWMRGKGIKLLTGVGKIVVEGAKTAYHHLDAMFDGTIGRLLTGAGKLGKTAINAAGVVARTPFRIIGKGADALEKHNIAKGYSTLSAQERMKVEGANNSEYTKALSKMSQEEANDFIGKVNLYANGANKAKTDLKDTEARLQDTTIATLKNGTMGDPKTRSQLEKLFKSARKAGNDDYSEVLNFINSLDESKISSADKASLADYINSTTASIKNKKKSIANFDQEQIAFFRDNKEKLGNMLTVDKNGKVGLNLKALEQTAMQARMDVRNLNNMDIDKLNASIAENKSKVAEEAKLKAAADVDPLGKQRNSILESILEVIKNLGKSITGEEVSEEKEEATQTPVEETVSETLDPKKKSKEYSAKTKAKIDELYAQGKTSAEIAAALHLNEKRVARYLGNKLVEKEQELAVEGYKESQTKTKFGRLKGLIKKGYNKFASTELGGDTIAMYKAIGQDIGSLHIGSAAKNLKNKIGGVVNQFTETHNEGDTKTETVDGKVLTYVWKSNKWEPDMSDSDTNEYFTEKNKDNTLKNKFFGMFTSGSLVNSFKEAFGLGENKDGEEKKDSLFTKLKNGALSLFTYFFGKDSFIGKAISSVLNGGLGTLLKSAFEGLVNSGALSTILSGAGIVLGANALANAGTDKDSGMRSDISAEDRKKQVAAMGIGEKTVTGLRNFENYFTNKKMTAYSSDDFVSSYTVDRYGNAIARNFVTGMGGGGLVGKLGSKLASKTIGRIPVVGKAFATPLTATSKFGSALAQNGTNLFKNAAAKLAGNESFLNTMANGGKLGEKIYDTVDAIGTNGLSKTFANSKVGENAILAVKAASKKVSNTRLGQTVISFAEKIKTKIQPIFKWIFDKLGVASTSAASAAASSADEAAEAIAKQGGNKLGTVLSKIGSIVYIAQVALDAEDGFETAKAKTILGIIDTPTFGQRLLAAGINAINYAIPGIGGIIPSNTIFNILWSILNKVGIDLGDLSEKRAAAQQTLAQYREMTGNPGATLEEYIHNELGEYTTQEKIKNTVGKGIKAIGTGIKNLPSNALKGVKTIGKGIYNTGKKAVSFVSSTATKTKDAVSNALNTISTKAKEGFDGLKEKVAPMGDIIKRTINTLSTYKKKGDIPGLLKASTRSKEDGAFGIVSVLTDSIYKRLFLVPTGLNAIGNKVKELVENTKSTFPDFKEVLSSLWEYTDSDKDMKQYDKTLEFYKIANSGGLSILANALISGMGLILKPIISVIRLGDKLANLLPGDKSGSSNNDSSSDSSSGDSGNSNSLWSKLKNGAENIWNNITGFFSGSGSGVHVSQKGSTRRFGNSDIDQNGCGPASAATVLRAYGKRANLEDAAKYAEAGGYVAGASGIGTRASYFGDVLGANGISTAYTASKSGIKSAVDSGRPTILLGQDAGNRSKSSSPFGPNPHYVVARGSDARGNVIIDDPELSRTAVYSKNILDKTKLGIMTGGGSNAIKESDGAVWNYLKSAGLTDAGVAGLMGNLYAESGITFNKVEGSSIKKSDYQSHDYSRDHGFSYDSVSYTNAVDKGLKEGLAGSADTNLKPTFGTIPKYEFTHMPWTTSRKKDDGTYFGQNGYGLVQWTTAARKSGLYDLAKSKGVSISDPQTQLEYLISELNSNSSYKNVLSTLTTTNDVRKASDRVLIDFEAPAEKNEEATQKLRASYGQTYYDQFTKNPPTSKDFGSSAFVASTTGATNEASSTDSGSTMSTTGSSTGSGLSSILNNGFSAIFKNAFGSLSGAAKSALGMIFNGFSGTSDSSTDESSSSSSLGADSSIQTTVAGDSTPSYNGIHKAVPTDAFGKGTPEAMVKIAQSQLGVVEGGGNNDGNITDYGKFMGMDGEPWCASFVSWIMDQTFGGDKTKRNKALRGNTSAAVSDLWSNFKSANSMSSTPQPGDVIIFKNNGASHTGIVETANGNSITTIEGNTGAGNEYERNGGVVARHQFTIGDGSTLDAKLTGFGRPDWSQATAAGSGLPIYDFTKQDRFKYNNYRGGDSNLTATSTQPVTTSTTKVNGKVVTAQEAAQMSYEEKMNKMIEYLSSIATNTGYAAAIPQIVSLMGDQIKVTAQVSANSGSSNTDVNNTINTEISSMMAKLDAIATSI